MPRYLVRGHRLLWKRRRRGHLRPAAHTALLHHAAAVVVVVVVVVVEAGRHHRHPHRGRVRLLGPLRRRGPAHDALVVAAVVLHHAAVAAVAVLQAAVAVLQPHLGPGLGVLAWERGGGGGGGVLLGADHAAAHAGDGAAGAGPAGQAVCSGEVVSCKCCDLKMSPACTGQLGQNSHDCLLKS